MEGDEGAPRASDPSEGGESGRSSPESISRPSLTLLAMLIEAITRCASSSAHEIAALFSGRPPPSGRGAAPRSSSASLAGAAVATFAGAAQPQEHGLAPLLLAAALARPAIRSAASTREDRLPW